MKKILPLLLCLLLLGCTPRIREESYIISDGEGVEIERITDKEQVDILGHLLGDTADRAGDNASIGAVPDEDGLYTYTLVKKGQGVGTFRVYKDAPTLSLIPRNGPTISWTIDPKTHATLTNLEELHRALEVN